jgi:hypothetical protein
MNKVYCLFNGHTWRYIGKRVSQWSWNDNVYQCSKCTKYTVTNNIKHCCNEHLIKEDYDKYSPNNLVNNKNF